MKKTQILLIVVALLLLGGILVYGKKMKMSAGPSAPASNDSSWAAFDPRNATYTVDGRKVTLKDGASEQDAAPGSPVRVKTKMWDEPLEADLDGDGKEDAVFIVTYDLGGSGSFYYVTAALRTAEGAKGLNAVLLGDRIAPQNIIVQQNGTFAVNYAMRNKGEPMTAPPTMGTTKYLKVLGGELVTTEPTP